MFIYIYKFTHLHQNSLELTKHAYNWISFIFYNKYKFNMYVFMYNFKCSYQSYIFRHLKYAAL